MKTKTKTVETVPVAEKVRRGDYNSKILYSKETRDAWRADESRLRDQFKQDLELEYGVRTQPKADKCFALAWEHGHASGLSEVLCYYSDFVELLGCGATSDSGCNCPCGHPKY